MSEEIAISTLRLYQELKPTSSLNDHYTVIASLYDNTRRHLVAFASGTQANLKNFQDDIEDCHAESLLKRAYKRYLIDKINSLFEMRLKETDIKQLVKDECEGSLSLFISQFPCGFLQKYEGQMPVLHRKPGRGLVRNDETYYVEKDCCLIKLKRWVSQGLQGHRLNSIFGFKSKIDKVVIGGCEPDQNLDYLSYSKLLTSEISCDRNIEIDVYQHVSCRGLVFSPSKRPDPVSIVWWNSSFNSSMGSNVWKFTQGSTWELIVDGQKRGLTKKQKASQHKRNRLLVSSASIEQAIASIEQRNHGTK